MEPASPAPPRGSATTPASASRQHHHRTQQTQQPPPCSTKTQAGRQKQRRCTRRSLTNVPQYRESPFLSHSIHAMEPDERESHLCSPASITVPKDRQHTDGNCKKLQAGTADTYPHEGAHRTQKKTLRRILAFLHKPMVHNRQAQKRFPLIIKKRASSWKHACTRPAFRYAPRSRHPPVTARSGRGTAPP